MNEWEVKPEILTDDSVAWNVAGRIDEKADKPRRLCIACTSRRRAQALARQLNAASYVSLEE